MNANDAARIEYYRRWLRPDWRRWLRPDWERYVHPAQLEAMRKDHALRDRAFETPLAKRLREENEDLRLREEKAGLEREQQDQAWQAECAERKRRADVAWECFKLALLRGDFAPRRDTKFNPGQSRVPAGDPEGGQWTSGDQPGEAKPVESSPDPERTRVAQYSFGTLLGQSRIRGGGWMCFYKFSFGTIMAPGTTNLGCSSWVTPAGVSHGKLIANDN